MALAIALFQGCATSTNIELGGAAYPEEEEEKLRDLAYSGTRVRVSDNEGNKTEGTIQDFSRQSLALKPSGQAQEQTIVFKWAEIAKIEAEKSGPSPFVGFVVFPIMFLVMAGATGLIDFSIYGN